MLVVDFLVNNLIIGHVEMRWESEYLRALDEIYYLQVGGYWVSLCSDNEFRPINKLYFLSHEITHEVYSPLIDEIVETMRVDGEVSPKIANLVELLERHWQYVTGSVHPHPNARNKGCCGNFDVRYSHDSAYIYYGWERKKVKLHINIAIDTNAQALIYNSVHLCALAILTSETAKL
jgi:hypothetical protein